MAAKLEQYRKTPRKRPDWAAMMKEIESSRQLKHVQTNDRSRPILPKAKAKGKVLQTPGQTFSTVTICPDDNVADVATKEVVIGQEAHTHSKTANILIMFISNEILLALLFNSIIYNITKKKTKDKMMALLIIANG